MSQSPFPHDDHNINKIFEIRRKLDVVFFKKFEGDFPLPEGMNFTHMKALLMTGFHQPVNMTGLSRFMQLEKGSFTPVAAKLIKMGYMEKIRDEQDRRAFNLDLTEMGRELVFRFAKTHGDYINEKLKKIDSEEQKEFFSLLDRLSELTGKMGT